MSMSMSMYISKAATLTLPSAETSAFLPAVRHGFWSQQRPCSRLEYEQTPSWYEEEAEAQHVSRPDTCHESTHPKEWAELCPRCMQPTQHSGRAHTWLFEGLVTRVVMPSVRS